MLLTELVAALFGLVVDLLTDDDGFGADAVDGEDSSESASRESSAVDGRR